MQMAEDAMDTNACMLIPAIGKLCFNSGRLPLHFLQPLHMVLLIAAQCLLQVRDIELKLLDLSLA